MTQRDEDAPAQSSDDVLLVVGAEPAAERFHVLRQRAQKVEAGVLCPLKEGQSIQGEVVRLEQRPESEALFDVKVELPAVEPSGGPARVASKAYRTNWDRIWGTRPGGSDRPS